MFARLFGLSTTVPIVFDELAANGLGGRHNNDIYGEHVVIHLRRHTGGGLIEPVGTAHTCCRPPGRVGRVRGKFTRRARVWDTERMSYRRRSPDSRPPRRPTNVYVATVSEKY